MKIIAITTNKGGVLKTSLSVNLAGLLADNHRVLVVDMDNQGNAGLSFGFNVDEFENTIYDVFFNNLHPEKAIVTASENIDLLPSNDDMTWFETDLIEKREKFPSPYHLLKHALVKVSDRYDYCIIDGPPTLGINTANILTAADEIIIPYQPEPYAMRSFIKTLQACERMKTVNKDIRVLGVVATLTDSRTNLHSQFVQECRVYCFENHLHMFDTDIPRSIRFASAINQHGLPATIVDRGHKMVKKYEELLKEVMEQWQEPHQIIR